MRFISSTFRKTMQLLYKVDLNNKVIFKGWGKQLSLLTADECRLLQKYIKGLTAGQIAEKLTIPNSASVFKVIEFKTPTSGLSTPINRGNPSFIGGGKTLGGAREFTIPNQPIPNDATIKIVK